MLDTKALAESTALIVKEHVQAAVAPLLDRIAALEAIELPMVPDVEAAVAKAIADLPAVEDGKDADPEFIAQQVRQAVDALPVPKDGKSVSLEDVRPLVDKAVGAALSALPSAKDGVGLAGAIIDRTGSLVVTMTDGSTKDLGPVVGKDADQAALERRIADTIAALPKAKDGENGFGFEDLSFEHDGERGFKLKFVQGDRIKEFAFQVPVVLDRGVYKEGQTYAQGDGVTWGGSYWIAQKETSAKPDSGEGFRLAVKRGRDAKAT